MDTAKLALDVLKISCESDTSECQLMIAKWQQIPLDLVYLASKPTFMIKLTFQAYVSATFVEIFRPNLTHV